jgi:hypothetical protein
MDRDELKATFHRVNTYRHVCEAVRASAGHTLFSGVFFAVIAGLYYNLFGPESIFFLIVAGLAVLEISVGVWKKTRPSVECVLLDSLCNLAFGGSVLARQVLAWQRLIAGQVNVISIFIGCWALYDAWNNFQSYLRLRKLFEVRPTRAQMRYVTDMARDIRDADPENDPTALDLPSDPPIQALLVDELAFLADPRGGDAIALDRSDLTVSRHISPDGRQTVGTLTLEGRSFPPFPLSDANWRNYLRWKGESPAE